MFFYCQRSPKVSSAGRLLGASWWWSSRVEPFIHGERPGNAELGKDSSSESWDGYHNEPRSLEVELFQPSLWMLQNVEDGLTSSRGCWDKSVISKVPVGMGSTSRRWRGKVIKQLELEDKTVYSNWSCGSEELLGLYAKNVCGNFLSNMDDLVRKDDCLEI